jgi:para-nitrobenzyl esterase
MSVWLGDEVRVDEDCLVVNVWTSASSEQESLPVLVFLHGGGFTHGSSAWPVYDGENLARGAHAVVVTVNHRLGVLGHLHLGDLGGEQYAGSGNVGLLDIVAALRWVAENIGAFGGDGANVTVFGESGGAAKTAFLLAMPSTEGLLKRAVYQSHPLPRALTGDEATSLADAVLAELQISRASIATLEQVPVEQLLDAQRRVVRRFQHLGGHLGGVTFGPVLDGLVVPQDPAPALAAGAASDLELLVGGAADETSIFHRQMSFDLDEAELERLLVRRAGPRAGEIVRFCRDAMPGSTASDWFTAAMNDMTRAGGIRLAESAALGGGTVYMYLLTWEADSLGSYHGVDLPMVFDNTDAIDAVARTPHAGALAMRMSGAWGAFARTGDPNYGDLPHWPPFDRHDRPTMVFDDQCHIAHDPLGDRRRIWADAYLDSAGDLI